MATSNEGSYEFCLVQEKDSSQWNFPSKYVEDDNQPLHQIVDDICKTAGIEAEFGSLIDPKDYLTQEALINWNETSLYVLCRRRRVFNQYYYNQVLWFSLDDAQNHLSNNQEKLALQKAVRTYMQYWDIP